MILGTSRSTLRLTEFLATVSGFRDEASAARGVAERAAEALGAELAAILQDGEVLTAVGCLHGLGACHTLATPSAISIGAGWSWPAPRAGSAEVFRKLRRTRVTEGVSGTAILEGRLGTVHDYERAPTPCPSSPPATSRRPWPPRPRDRRGRRQPGRGSYDPGRTYSRIEQEVLLAFAEQASLALKDARTVDAMHQAFHDPPSWSTRVPQLEHQALNLGRADRGGAGRARPPVFRGGVGGGQRRHRPQPARQGPRRRAAPQRRHRDAPGQGRRHPALHGVRAGHAGQCPRPHGP